MRRCNCKKWFEPIGLILLLFSFGWQCIEEDLSQIRSDGYLYELNQKIENIWAAVYDEALDSDRYKGNGMVSVNYDCLNQDFKGWEKMQEEFSSVNKQLGISSWCRIFIYVLGSGLIIWGKWPQKKIEG